MNPKFPNPLVVFENNFEGHRRHYADETRLAIATDLGFEGYECNTLEPGDPRWESLPTLFEAHPGLHHLGMYIVCRGLGENDNIDRELERFDRILAQLARWPRKPYALVALYAEARDRETSRQFHLHGWAGADESTKQRAHRLVAAIDERLGAHQIEGFLYPHLWFVPDTPAAALRLINETGARHLRLGLPCLHAHLHRDVTDLPDLLTSLPSDEPGYVALLNLRPKPEPFTTQRLDAGVIDMAAWCGHLWRQNYTGPLIIQGYNLGGDVYANLCHGRDYLRGLWERFQTRPECFPLSPPRL